MQDFRNQPYEPQDVFRCRLQPGCPEAHMPFAACKGIRWYYLMTTCDSNILITISATVKISLLKGPLTVDIGVPLAV